MYLLFSLNFKCQKQICLILFWKIKFQWEPFSCRKTSCRHCVPVCVINTPTSSHGCPPFFALASMLICIWLCCRFFIVFFFVLFLLPALLNLCIFKHVLCLPRGASSFLVDFVVTFFSSFFLILVWENGQLSLRWLFFKHTHWG